MPIPTPLRCALGLLLATPACGDETPVTDDESSEGSSGGSSATGATTADTSAGTDTSATQPTGGPETSGEPDTDGSSESPGTSEGPSASCGDGQLDPGELCDDGNDDEEDECTTLCLPPSCGDGLVQSGLGEGCDDGNDDNFDACPSDCLAAECGDGIREGEEGCDDGLENGNGTSTCTSACAENVCGDGYVATLMEACDEAAANGDGTSTCTSECQRNRCGDGYVLADAYEQCDDGDENGIGLCSRTCTTTIVAAGLAHTCARSPEGNVRCWGFHSYGALGYGNLDNVGDDEVPADAGDVDVGGTVVGLAAGGLRTCVVLEGNTLRCWGNGFFGSLGLGTGDQNIGDDDVPSDAPEIDLGGPVLDVAMGTDHSCALLMDGTVRCWGYRACGTPGYGAPGAGQYIGDDESPSVPEALVDVGGTVVQITAAQDHTCAVLEDGALVCWGSNSDGRLGYGYATGFVGDDETPADVGAVQVGEPVLEVAGGAASTCVLLAGGRTVCAGDGQYGGLASGNTADQGLGDSFENLPDAPIGIDARHLFGHTALQCASGATGNLRCWGSGEHGYMLLGYVGDDETPEALGDLEIDEPVVAVTSGIFQTCITTFDGGIRCWGENPRGELGYGNIVDQHLAENAPDLEIWD